MGNRRCHEQKISRSKNSVARGRGLISDLISSLKTELHLPGYNFCGPNTLLRERLLRGDKGVNKLDAHCKTHDIAYRDNKDINNRHAADRTLAEQAWERVKSEDASLGEKAAAWLVTSVMKSKVAMGSGIRKKLKRACKAARRRPIKSCKGSGMRRKLRRSKTLMSKRRSKINNFNVRNALHAVSAALHKTRATSKGGKRVINGPSAYGGFLPLILPILPWLAALGSIAGGAAGIAKAVNDAKYSKKTLAELQRHNIEMEKTGKGSGFEVKRSGKSFKINVKKSKKKKLQLIVKDEPTSNMDLVKMAKKYGIKNFKVLMRDELILKPRNIENLIVNLDLSRSKGGRGGTHWIAIKKRGRKAIVFDSFGNLKPPSEILHYLKGTNIFYNRTRYQNFGSHICGQLCIAFLLSDE